MTEPKGRIIVLSAHNDHFIRLLQHTCKFVVEIRGHIDNDTLINILFLNKLNQKRIVLVGQIKQRSDFIKRFKITEIITRLNIGRIPLTNAELVKALFLCQTDQVTKSKQMEISLQWDTIERELHDDDLWYFLTKKYLI